MTDDDITVDALVRELSVDKVAAAELAALTERQRECLLLAAKGLSSVEIGKALFISYKTVEHHMKGMRAALEMTTIEAAVLACKAGWL